LKNIKGEEKTEKNIGKKGKRKKRERRRKELRLRCKSPIQKDLEALALV
jgi:hypothetical protein